MSTYFGVTSDSVSSLFSSLNTSSTSSTASYISDFANIKNGSYKKLLTAYYNKTGDTGSSANSSTSTATDSTKNLTAVKSATDSLKDSADALLTKGKNSVFNKVSSTDSEGNTTTDYDTEAIYKAVSSFVDSYNTTLDSMDKISATSLTNNVKNMVNTTAKNSKLLSEIGITVGSDYSLSIDKAAFAKADMGTVKSLFNEQGSYGYSVSAKASMMNFNASNEAGKASTYNQTGSYSYNYSAGNLIDSLT